MKEHGVIGKPVKAKNNISVQEEVVPRMVLQLKRHNNIRVRGKIAHGLRQLCLTQKFMVC